MKCPHCGTDFHEDWFDDLIRRARQGVLSKWNGIELFWRYRATLCSKCKQLTIELAPGTETELHSDWRMVYPISATRGPVPPEVPGNIATDYVEACNVLAFSAKASAALSRRCLQNILHEFRYKGRDLNMEIDLLLNEPDPMKAIPRRLRETVDAIRNFACLSG